MSILKKVKAAGIGLACMAMCLLGGLTAQAASLVWPVPGHTTLSQGYHDGGAIDISDGSIAGAKVVAAIGGTVTYKFTCGTQHYGSYGDCHGFGTGIVINGDDGRIYQYAHMQANSIPSNVYCGARVEAGQTIGAVGTTGNSSGNHLHFGISTGNYWTASGINPQNETYTNASASVSYQNLRATMTTNTNANLYGQIINSSRATVTYVGVNIWDSAGKQVVKYSEYCGLSYSSINQNLNVNEEAKVTLTPGTDYTFQMWAMVGGKTYTSGTGSFRTTGSVTTTTTTTTTKKDQVITASDKTKTLGCWAFYLGAKRTTGNGALSYTSSDTSVATVSSLGIVRVKGVGKTTITITAAETSTYNKATKQVTITVNPKGTTLSSAKNLSGKKVMLRWRRNSAVSGYQIQVSQNQNFAGAKTYKVSQNKTTKRTLTGMTKGKTYYFRIRTYKTVNGTTYYSGWSGSKNVKIKK